MKEEIEVLDLESDITVVDNKDDNKKKRKNNKKKSSKKKTTKKDKNKINGYTKFLIVVDVFAVVCFFLAYGPISFFRDMLVTSALTTMSHHYLAYVLYSEEQVQEIVDNNVVVETGEVTDTSSIKVSQVEDTGVYESIYEEEILKRDEGNELYKIVKLKGSKYEGYMVVIYDPSRVSLVSANKLSTGGETVLEMAKRSEAQVAINGGGFIRKGVYTTPGGNVISNSKIVHSNGKQGRIIGFNNDNVLVLARYTAKEAINAGIRDGMEFGPFLIVNGKSANIKGNGGYGIHPRTAIGQRQDGIVLFVVIDGRNSRSVGAKMSDLIDIFTRYKAYNAANLDGGGSTTLVVNNKIKNDPSATNSIGQRYVANGWIVK